MTDTVTITRNRLPDGPVLAYLAHCYADMREPHTNLSLFRKTKYRFEGACETLHALGVGATPQAVYQAIANACQAHGDRPPTSDAPDLRGAWTANVVATLLTTEVIG